jgi:hypothetical protein
MCTKFVQKARNSMIPELSFFVGGFFPQRYSQPLWKRMCCIQGFPAFAGEVINFLAFFGKNDKLLTQYERFVHESNLSLST